MQLRKEDERWKRDQRHTAYQAMIRADMAHMAAGQAVRGERVTHADVLAPELVGQCERAQEESTAAVSLIELCGPLRVLEAARELHWAGEEVMHVFAFPTSQVGYESAESAVIARQYEAVKAFRSAARDALGYSASEDWAPSQPPRP
ncbi:hypothetical protein [Streptomyces sp. NPDC046939]|uniref:hypothetical protein n=1 Tax=Streptomyces sp. NPDC046939 TaxID=3155376 RepID=UPI003400BF87